jgi:hypothetical protein
MVTVVLLDGSTKNITDQQAIRLRESWVRKHYANQAQADFAETIQKIVYTSEEEYCFHRYKLHHVIPMGRSNGYVMRCSHCSDSYATDQQPVDN